METEFPKEYERDMWLTNASVSDLVTEFMLSVGQPINEEWYSNSDLRVLRETLVEEEFEEFLGARSPEDMLKELVDLVYVILGYCITFGWDFDEAFQRVHESNMSKLIDGRPVYRDDGKVLKGPNYNPPNLEDLV